MNFDDADRRHGGYGHICWEGCDVWKDDAPALVPEQSVSRKSVSRKGNTLDPWGFGVELPDNGQRIKFRLRRDRDRGWLLGMVDFCWCGIEPAIKLVEGPNVYPTLGDEWRPA